MNVRPILVGGEWLTSGDPRPVLNPWNGEALAHVSWGSQEHLERALQAASQSEREMRKTSRFERSRWCQRIATGLDRRAEEFAQLITAESGKPIRFARDEVKRAITTFTLAASEALNFRGEVIPLDIGAATSGYLGYSSRIPCGTVAAITPFNFPLNLVAHKVAPALAVGNPIILKPAPATPLTSLLLSQLVLESGVPAPAFSCLNLDVPQIQSLVTDARTRFVSFTGSAKVGWELKALASHKKVALELGGNAAAIVHSDANLDFAVARLAAGGYAYAGQVCISVQRIYVERSIYGEFRDRFVAAVEALGVGDPTLESTVVGPLIHPRELARIEEWLQGHKPLCGGKAEPPIFLPTVLEQVEPQARIAREEVFGPVTILQPYDDFGEAIAAVNDSDFGLQVGIFTRDLERVLACHDELEVGGVVINDYPTFRVDNMPYGGVKQSGFGREGVAYTMEEMSEIRLLAINRNPLQ